MILTMKHVMHFNQQQQHQREEREREKKMTIQIGTREIPYEWNASNLIFDRVMANEQSKSAKKKPNSKQMSNPNDGHIG